MKYGIIIHNYGEYAKVSPGYNVGDTVQTLAMEYIYQYMGIDEKDILKIQLSEIKNYCGEYVLLPIYSAAVGIGYAPLPLSPRIIPVFISTHIATTELTEEEVAYLRTYEPIGCRDEYSLNTMRKYNIQAYLSGCMTVVFPQRKQLPKQPKVYMVDTPESLESYLPQEIRQNAVRYTHMLPIQEKEMTLEEAEDYYERSKAIMDEYQEHASLVISSRLHALVPCMAIGIPVIAVFENISYRFSWLDKFLKLYSISNFKDIDWNPAPIAYEPEKQKLLDLFASQIRIAHEKYAPLYEISEFYENRQRALYGNFYQERVETMHEYMPEEFGYLIWGCGLIGTAVHKVMQKEFPQARLIAAVDNFVTGEWHEVPVIKPSQIEDYPDAFVLLATYSGRAEGYQRMQELGREENRDFLYVATQNG